MIRFGLVGCGRISERHAASLARCEGAALAALCDVRAERMDAIEAAYAALSADAPRPARYATLAAMLAAEQVDAVVIATPSGSHAPLALEAIAHGKPVLLEKPLALSLAEADAIASAARRQGVLVQMCHQLRYKPVMRQAKRAVASGALGRLHLGVVSMRLQRSQAYYDAAAWRGTWQHDGGMLLNQGIHLIDLLRWFMGDADQVVGRMTRGPIPKQTEDVAAGIVQFKSGAIGMIEANTLTYPASYDNSITLFGEAGTISIGGLGLNEVRQWALAKAPEGLATPDGAADEHVAMYAQLVRALEGDRSAAVITAEEGRQALELIFGLYESVRSGASVKLPLADFATSRMNEMEGWK